MSDLRYDALEAERDELAATLARVRAALVYSEDLLPLTRIERAIAALGPAPAQASMTPMQMVCAIDFPAPAQSKCGFGKCGVVTECSDCGRAPGKAPNPAQACSHKGIGLPGCSLCDFELARVRAVYEYADNATEENRKNPAVMRAYADVAIKLEAALGPAPAQAAECQECFGSGRTDMVGTEVECSVCEGTGEPALR